MQAAVLALPGGRAQSLHLFDRGGFHLPLPDPVLLAAVIGEPARAHRHFEAQINLADGVLLVPTTVVGSYPQPDWLVDRQVLGSRLPPRVRAREIWRVAPEYLGLSINSATVEHLQFMVVGALIILFLVVEPHGLARLWQIGKQKLRVWPFPY